MIIVPQREFSLRKNKMNHADLIKRAKAAIADVFNDVSVSVDQRIDSLDVLLDAIEICIGALERDRKEFGAI